MKLFDIRRISVRNKLLLALATMAVTLPSCEKIWEGEGDCSRNYKVAFTFTRNMVGSDAFVESVNSVSLFVFDTDGNLVTSKAAFCDSLANDGYALTLDNVEPGTYDLVVWGGLLDGDAFQLAGGDNPLTKDDIVCRLNRQYDNDGNAYSNRQLNSLFHGMADSVVFPDAHGTMKVATIDLMKNTNTLRVAIHQKNGRPLEADRFSFRLADNNGLMNYDNQLLDDEFITFGEWTIKEDVLENPENSRAGNYATDGTITAVIAELSLPRLMSSHDPVLLVEYEGRIEPVVNLHLMQLLELAKGEDRKSMQFQDYLDREDDYTMFFNVDDDNSWYMPAGIFINGWKVVFQESNM